MLSVFCSGNEWIISVHAYIELELTKYRNSFLAYTKTKVGENCGKL